MNKKTLLIFSIIGIIGVTVSLLGFTYAYYFSDIIENTKSKSVEVITANKNIKFTDLAATETSDTIAPGYTNIKFFTIENTGNTITTYHIYLDEVVNEFKRSGDLKYTLYKKTGNNSLNATNYKEGEVIAEGIFPKNSSYLKTSENIEVDEIYTYAFKVEYINSSQNQDVDQGHVFSSKIQIHGYLDIPFEEGTLAYEILNNAKKAHNRTIYKENPISKVAEETSKVIPTGAYENKTVEVVSYYWTYADNPDEAMDGAEVTSCTNELIGKWLYDVYDYFDEEDTTDLILVTGCDGDKPMYEEPVVEYEQVLSVATDDFGDSYYFRGAIQDNYVNFAGMCWRIVRIDGNSNIKIVLEDSATTCNSPTYTGNWSIGYANYGYETKNVDSDSSDEYMMSYLEPKDDANISMVKYLYDYQETLDTKISTMYDENTIYDYLISGNWCLSDKAYSRSGTSSPYTYGLLGEDGYSYNYGINMYYDSYVRLYGQYNQEGYKPDLKCRGEKMDYFYEVINADDETLVYDSVMFIGTLTIDEVIYAGGKAGSSSGICYLTNDYQNYQSYDFWWTLSPSDFYNYGDRVFYIGENAYIGVTSVSDEYGVVRPAITLKANIPLSADSGNGTQKEPYVIG